MFKRNDSQTKDNQADQKQKDDDYLKTYNGATLIGSYPDWFIVNHKNQNRECYDVPQSIAPKSEVLQIVLKYLSYFESFAFCELVVFLVYNIRLGLQSCLPSLQH